MNPRALEVALENSLRNGKESIALALMKEAKENGTPIRQHYFWPLIIHRGKKNDIAGKYCWKTVMYVELIVVFEITDTRSVMQFL